MSASTDKPLPRADIQGNVLLPYKFERVRHLLLRVVDAGRARAAIRKLAAEVTSSAPWAKHKPETTLNLGLAHAGLVALELDPAVLAEMPYAFRAGMKRRAPMLGDWGDSAPEKWEDDWKQPVHAILTIHAKKRERLGPRAVELAALVAGGFEVAFEEEGGVLTEKGFAGPGEHFGWRDGIGQTAIAGSGKDPGLGDGNPEGDGWRGVAPGELLLGHENESGELPFPAIRNELARNGTFLVFRKLAQRIDAFRDYVDRHGAAYGDKEKFGAKIIGRWKDGTPIALSPDAPDPGLADDPTRNNAFGYADDLEGAKCPLGAHIRRTRPRDALGFGGKLANMRRMMRRGLPYGKWVPEGERADASPRGLLFYAFNVDIEGQFEFVQQQWLNYGNHFGQGNDKDVVSGDHDGAGKAVIQAANADDVPYLCTALERFIQVRGGEYFFVPGLAALEWIANGGR